jgi:hypothetical protein
MGWIIHQRRLTPLEQAMSDDLGGHANDDQNRRRGPHADDACVIHDRRRCRQQKRGHGHDRKPEHNIQSEPVDQDRQHHQNGETGMAAEPRKRPHRQGKNGRQEQEDDPKDMRDAVPGITVILHIIGQLAPEQGVHAGQTPDIAGENILGVAVTTIRRLCVITVLRLQRG